MYVCIIGGGGCCILHTFVDVVDLEISMLSVRPLRASEYFFLFLFAKTLQILR